jgi:hypothetical protein
LDILDGAHAIIITATVRSFKRSKRTAVVECLLTLGRD